MLEFTESEAFQAAASVLWPDVTQAENFRDDVIYLVF